MEQLEQEVFGYLTVLEYDEEKKKWKCQCQCGNITYVPTKNLKTGNTKSCGCMQYAKGIKKPRKEKYEILEYKDVGQLRVVKLNLDKGTAICFCLECEGKNIEMPLDELYEMYKTRKKSYTCGINGCEYTRLPKNSNGEKKEKKRTSNSIKAGDKFGNLTVKKRIENKISKTKNSFCSIPMFLCKCSCGGHIEVQGRYLIGGKTKSCGCLKGSSRKSTLQVPLSTEEGTVLYGIYNKWKYKFNHPTSTFKRKVIDCGIKFFPEIANENNSFELFYQWAMINGFSLENKYLERKNYFKDFSKNNCFWTSNKTRGY